MLNKNQNNHGHLFVKVSAALAAMAIVSATSVEMYQIFGENKNMTSAQNQTSSQQMTPQTPTQRKRQQARHPPKSPVQAGSILRLRPMR